MLTLVAIADTHGYHQDLTIPEGDILIHAGDLTRQGTLEELAEVNQFLAGLPHRHKVVVAGNHDWCFQKSPAQARTVLTAATYLEDESTIIEGLKFHGSPWQPWFMDWAFNLPRGPELARRWAQIPDDTDILITHGPPLGFGDHLGGGERCGCEELLKRVRQVRPKLHLFGHIHQDGGVWTEGATTFANVTSDECMLPPRVLTLPQVVRSA
ncbi:metallophosphatase domain-containing protein [Pyxidicoccus trucidator]|uniref:metallophosphatase domain-containing protein n=1 Tax=Pyxidicoccus trucidator TaxID=2709662 RepID=UPI001968508F|nr:metallophosphatase domain-containing protein [Pyxidicoccus trucidator]